MSSLDLFIRLWEARMAVGFFLITIKSDFIKPNKKASDVLTSEAIYKSLVGLILFIIFILA